MASLTLGMAPELLSQKFEIGVIDFYGLTRVPAAQIRRLLTVREGDTVSVVGDERPAFLAESERRIMALAGVARVNATLTCCEEGRAIIYIGIQESDAAAMQFRAAPRGTERLPDDVVQAGARFTDALTEAVRRGEATEDDTQGHALAHDSATRVIQEQFIRYAARDLPRLREVLRNSSDDGHRALAAQVLGYVADKQSVVDDLVAAISDPSEEVRNNAMRALLVFAAAAPSAGRPVPTVPYTPFVSLLSSIVWSDRNKASGALMRLSQKRDPALLELLRTQAIPQLAEMARWKTPGHALFAYFILARIAGYADEKAQGYWTRGEREVVIKAALKRSR